MKIGCWYKLPHYAVIGEKNKLYLWVNEDGNGTSSNWIKGRVAFQLHSDLKQLFKQDKSMFVELLKKHHRANPLKTGKNK